MSERPLEVNIDAKVVPPGGYVIATLPDHFNPELIEEMADQIRSKYPDLRMVFFQGGVEIEVAAP